MSGGKKKVMAATLSETDVAAVTKFRDAIRRALDAASENGYDELDERPEDISENMVTVDADLECFSESRHLLVPYIEEWQFEQRCRKKLLK